MSNAITFPRQALPDSKKGKAWRRKCMEWGDSRTYMHHSPVRKSVRHKQINIDLLNGKLYMDDLALVLNPADVQPNFLPENIQHFPIMNSSLETLIGEEMHRPFKWRAVVVNPNAATDVEEVKKQELLESLTELVENVSFSEEDYMRKLEELSDYYEYDYQDFREIRANELLKFYIREENIPMEFHHGFRSALAVGEECYDLDIIGGNPTLRKVNVQKLRAYGMGYSNKFEDADIILYEDYWPIGKVFDAFYDQLTEKDIKYIENTFGADGNGMSDSMGTVDSTRSFIDRRLVGEEFVDDGSFFWDPDGAEGITQSMQPFDNHGNIRVMTMRWKSRRRIKKVRKFDEETGEEYFEFYNETYVPDEDLGETAQDMYVNEAWEGTMIGGHILNNPDVKEADPSHGILVNVRPRPVQYPDMDNPSKCFLGYVGTLYNFNDDEPYSMVDMMKPYNYLYDVLHYRLMDAIASMWGSLAVVDLAMIPADWKVEQWMYFARTNHIAVQDSFREGSTGASQGKLAASMNSNTQKMLTDMTGDYIQQLMNLAMYVKQEMKAMIGVTPQREGQIANRETVGGVERSVLQSSYITERYFALHRDTKRRALNMLLETAKIAMRGRKVSFRYKTSDLSWKLMEFDGDEFAENNYGIIVDDSDEILNLDQKIESLGQAAMQNSKLKFGALMKMMLSSDSIAEKIRIIENSERKADEEARQMQEMQMQQAQMASQTQMQVAQAQLESQMAMNKEDNETKVLVAQIQAENKVQTAQLQGEYKLASIENDGIPEITPDVKAKLDEQIREFNLKLRQEDKKIDILKEKNQIMRASADKRNN